MGVKSFFQKIFGIDPNKNTLSAGSQAQFLSGSANEYSRYTGEMYANHLVRSIVHKIATYCSMVRFEHVRGSGKDFEQVKTSRLNRLLTVKPNDLLMSPADLQYKYFTDLWVTNNAYLWIKRAASGDVLSLLPVVADRTEMREINGFLFYKFYFPSGDKLVVYAGDIVHTRRFFYKNDWFGDSNEPLRDPVGLVNTMDESLDAALKNGAQIKGILQHQNTIDPDDLAKHEQMFRESYLKASNSGGVGMIDAKFNFIPINYTGKITDAEQMKEIRDYVYRYFQVNDDILMSKYNSETWQAFHEGVIAPELNKFEQSMALHVFTDKELGYGNRIQSSVNKMSFMSNQQKISMVKLALDGALYNRNEIREWFGDAPIPGGDVYQYSKNFTEETDQNPNQQKEEENATGTETNPTDSTDAVPQSETND